MSDPLVVLHCAVCDKQLARFTQQPPTDGPAWLRVPACPRHSNLLGAVSPVLRADLLAAWRRSVATGKRVRVSVAPPDHPPRV